jgi:hypothetical protein
LPVPVRLSLPVRVDVAPQRLQQPRLLELRQLRNR